MSPFVLNGIAWGMVFLMFAMFVLGLLSRTMARTVATLICTTLGILAYVSLAAWSVHRLLVVT